MSGLHRAQILPEPELPDVANLIAQGKRLAQTITVATCPFLSKHDVASEAGYKRRQSAVGEVMFHAQIGFRDLSKTQRAYAEIYERWRTPDTGSIATASASTGAWAIQPIGGPTCRRAPA